MLRNIWNVCWKCETEKYPHSFLVCIRYGGSLDVAEEGKSTTPTCGGVGKWVEELPWELWELVLGNLSVVDRLSYVTSMKVMIEKYEKGSKLAALREEARDEVQIAREERHAQRLKAAIDYYIMYNIELRQPGVCYKNVVRQFRIGKPDLQEGVEARQHGDNDEDSAM